MRLFPRSAAPLARYVYSRKRQAPLTGASATPFWGRDAPVYLFHVLSKANLTGAQRASRLRVAGPFVVLWDCAEPATRRILYLECWEDHGAALHRRSPPGSAWRRQCNLR
jgi:hypothetical protein